jgi:hypothetical protein
MNKTASPFTPEDKQLIMNYLKGGLYLGGSASLATSLIGYLRDLKQRADKYKETSESDDDTMYVDLPAVSKSATFTDDLTNTLTSFSAPGLALTGSMLTAGGSYYLVRKLFQQLKKKELQDEMDKAQHAFVNSLNEENMANKEAAVGDSMTFPSFLAAYPVTLMLLSTLASGALTYKSLDKAFPAVKPPQRLAPKRVVLRRQRPSGVEDSVDDSTSASDAKEASASDAEFASGVELLAHMLCMQKNASSDVSDIVHAVAAGRHDEFVNNLLEYGLDAAMDSIKGASDDDISEEQKAFAILKCTKSAALSPSFSLLVASEYNDMVPNMVKLSSEVDEEQRELLVKIAGALGESLRRNILSSGDIMNLVKEAQPIEEPKDDDDFQEMNYDHLLDIIMNQLHTMRPKEQAGAMPDLDGNAHMDSESVQNSDDVVDEDSIASDEEKQVNDMHPTKTNKATPAVIDELGADDDHIDKALSTPITAAKAVAAENA